MCVLDIFVFFWKQSSRGLLTFMHRGVRGVYAWLLDEYWTSSCFIAFSWKSFFFLLSFEVLHQCAANCQKFKCTQAITMDKKWHFFFSAEIANKQCRYSAIVPFVCGSGEVEQLLLKYIERQESRNILLCADFSLQLCAYFSSLTVQICLGW